MVASRWCGPITRTAWSFFSFIHKQWLGRKEMELADVRIEVPIAAVNARRWADQMEWTVCAFERAGLCQIELVRGYTAAAERIEDKKWVLLGQLGDGYMVGKLT